jgi:GNAT superfamily N-acetyltransferase
MQDSLLREVAEYPNAFGPLGANEERIETDRYTLWMGLGRSWNTVQRQRFAEEEVDEVLAEVRGLLRARGRERTQWEVGSSAAPGNLVELLLVRGLVRDKDPYTVALVLREAPPHVPGIVARRVVTFEEYAAANQVQWEAFGGSEAELAERRALLEPSWKESATVMHAAWMDGELVCAGTSAPTPHGLLLYGGATLPRARRRGAYRALLRARWDEAVLLGTPTLITQGGSMSRPILERLGFQPIGHVHVLVDAFGDERRERS